MITKIQVNGLFGRFNYGLQLQSGGITLLTGPNGFGKSTLFSLVESACKGNRAVIADTHFSSLQLTTNDGKVHKIEKNNGNISVDGQTLTFGEFVAGKACPALNEFALSVGNAETVGSRRFLDSALKNEGELGKYVAFIKGIPDKIASAYKSDEHRAKVQLLVELLQEKLTFKKVEIVNEKLTFIDDSGKELHFTDLSAGEIQLCAFYAELLFDAKKGTLLLIDEPEVSMHIVWQFSLVDEVERICALTGAYAVIATHSPQILNGHFDLQVDLGEQYGR